MKIILTGEKVYLACRGGKKETCTEESEEMDTAAHQSAANKRKQGMRC